MRLKVAVVLFVLILGLSLLLALDAHSTALRVIGWVCAGITVAIPVLAVVVAFSTLGSIDNSNK